MIAKSTILALRALAYLAGMDSRVALPPRRIAEALGESPTYLAKVLRHLVRSGILRAEKGAKGGLRLNQPPVGITMLAIVESCQGAILGAYCNVSCAATSFCHYHAATLELHHAICDTLSRWTLADILKKPAAAGARSGCFMAKGSHGPIRPTRFNPAPQKRRLGGPRG